MPARVKVTAHSVIWVPITEGAVGAAIPVLILSTGQICYITLTWIRKLMLDGAASASKLTKAIKAIGRLHDFYVLEKKNESLTPHALPNFIAEFYEARWKGNANLNWDDVHESTAIKDLRFVNDFSRHCAENFGHSSLNPSFIVKVGNLSSSAKAIARARLKARKHWDCLYHLTPATQEGQGTVEVYQFNPERSKRKAQREAKSFPAQFVMPLLASTLSIRDRLCFLLLFFGGIRASELLHIFVRDVSVDNRGIAVVTIADPKDSKIEWSSVSGTVRTTSRATFLQAKYGLGPRNLLGKHPMHAGFKGMQFDNIKKCESQVTWLWDEAGRAFAELHFEYMRTVRTKLPDNHPYYLVNDANNEFYGAPLKMSNLRKLFSRAVERVGLKPFKDDASIHNPRHFYGFALASWLRVPIATAQKMLHHKYQSSTQVYYHLDKATANHELQAGRERAKAEASTIQAKLLNFFKGE